MLQAKHAVHSHAADATVAQLRACLEHQQDERSHEAPGIFFAHSPLKAFAGYSASRRVLGELTRAAVLLQAEGERLEMRVLAQDFIRAPLLPLGGGAQPQRAPSPADGPRGAADEPMPPELLHRVRDVCALLDHLSSAHALTSALDADQMLELLSAPMLERAAGTMRAHLEACLLASFSPHLVEPEDGLGRELGGLCSALYPLWAARLRARQRVLVLAILTASAHADLPRLMRAVEDAPTPSICMADLRRLPGVGPALEIIDAVSPLDFGTVSSIVVAVIVSAHRGFFEAGAEGRALRADSPGASAVFELGCGLPFVSSASSYSVGRCADALSADSADEDEDAQGDHRGALPFAVFRAAACGELSSAQLCALVERELQARRYAFAALLAHTGASVFSLGSCAVGAACACLGAIAALSAAPPEWVHFELRACGLRALSPPRSEASLAQFGALCRRVLCGEGAWHASAGAALEACALPQAASELLQRLAAVLEAAALSRSGSAQRPGVRALTECGPSVSNLGGAYAWDVRSSPKYNVLRARVDNERDVKASLDAARAAVVVGGGGGNSSVPAGGGAIEAACDLMSAAELRELNMLASLFCPSFDLLALGAGGRAVRVRAAVAEPLAVLRQLDAFCGGAGSVVSSARISPDDGAAHAQLFGCFAQLGDSAMRLLDLAQLDALRTPLERQAPHALDAMRDIARASALRAVRAGGASARALLARCRSVAQALLSSAAARAESQVLRGAGSPAAPAAPAAKAARAHSARRGGGGGGPARERRPLAAAGAAEGVRDGARAGARATEAADGERLSARELERAAAARAHAMERAAAADAAAHARAERETELAMALSAADARRARAAEPPAVPSAAGGAAVEAAPSRAAPAAAESAGHAGAAPAAAAAAAPAAAARSGCASAANGARGSLPRPQAPPEAELVAEGASADGRALPSAAAAEPSSPALACGPDAAAAASPFSPPPPPPAARGRGGWETITPSPPPHPAPPGRLLQFGSFPPISLAPIAHVHARRALLASFGGGCAGPAPCAAAAAVVQQVEFYFSEGNLARDAYLRGLMDALGWVDVAAIAAFNRMRGFALDVGAIAGVLTGSEQLDVDQAFVGPSGHGVYRVRARHHWARFTSTA